MQPPPRKGNYGKFLKNLHAEQLTKLHLKNQHECDLLEDIRQFTVKRSAIEKSYSEALLKISGCYLNKKIPNIPDIKIDGADEKWNMWSVWRTVLEENEKLARARLAAIEVFQQQIADESKVLRDYKLQLSKKYINQLANIQKEVQISVQEIDKTKKQYFDEEHSAHDVRDKARDIEEKLKKKKGSFFQSITSLQKNSARVTSRKEQLEEKSTGARNDYLLSLVSANAHQTRYFTVDLQSAMTGMENYVYERIADYLMLMGRTELLTCSATQHSFSKIRDQAHQLTREYNLQCCYLYYPVLKQHIQYDFEACDNDPVRKITVEHDSAAATLTREAKNLAGKIVRYNNTVRDNARKLAVCVAMRDAGQKVDPNDANGPDLETKIEEFRENIRRAETERCKCEGNLECLREGGINVDEWIQEAEKMGVQEIPRSNSSTSIRTDTSGQGENPSSDSFYDSDNAEQEVPPAIETKETVEMERVARDSDDMDSILEQERQKIDDLTAGWEDPAETKWDEDAEEQSATTSAMPDVKMLLATVIYKCTALYSYTAQNPDELSIVENEQLEVIEESDGDGWLRARNYRGEEGYVPNNYLDVEKVGAVGVTSTPQTLQSQISFFSVDYTIETEDHDAFQDSAQSPDQVSVISAPVTQQKTGSYCIAMYDYDATAEDELTFEEGQIIKIIRKTVHGIDDGWWEGELDNKIGNFPSLVVEECDEHGESLFVSDDESDNEVVPPASLPPIPPVIMIANDDEMVAEFDTGEKNKENLELTFANKLKYNGNYQADSSVDVKKSEKVTAEQQRSSAKSEFGLGTAQIIVTAATPMVEDSEKKFAPDEKKEDMDSSHDDDGTVIESMKMMSDKSIEPIAEEPESEVTSPASNEPELLPQESTDNHFDSNFDANFDAVFGNGGSTTATTVDSPDPPKQVIGGRASIPDELAPHQLERLQNLKESNA